MKSILYGRSGKWVRRALLFLMDLGFVCLSAYLALLLRFDGAISKLQFARTMNAIPFIMAIYAACGVLFGIYDMLWRFASGPEFFRLSMAYATAGLIIEHPVLKCLCDNLVNRHWFAVKL